MLFAATAPARADVWADLAATERAIGQLDGSRTQSEARRAGLEQESRALATEIERVKAEPAGVRRDLHLQDLLAAQRSKSDELDHIAADLRGRTSLLSGARRKLLGDCDRALAMSLSEAKRLELTRLRTAQAAWLATPDRPLALGVTSPTPDPLDGPRELQDKADLLRDSGDKLRREVQRLGLRIDGVEQRRRLRERAGAIDEDLFGEAVSNRHAARVTTLASGGATSTPTAGTGAGAGGAPGAGGAGAPGGAGGAAGAGGTGGGSNGVGNGQSSGGGLGNSGPATDSTTTLRNLVDPSTLDELRRADGGDDLERQLRALRHAQGELDGLAKELDRRAHDLSKRADELKHKK